MSENCWINDSVDGILRFVHLNTSGKCRPRWLSWMRRPTGDQEVAGTTPPRSATFFRGD